MSDVLWLLWGPNLNRLGTRQPEIYGSMTIEDHVEVAREAAVGHGWDVSWLQSSSEAELVGAIHRATDTSAAAIALNPGAFTHYAWGLQDALAGFPGPVVEFHLSNPERRESWRHTSVVSPVADATLTGCGAIACRLAVEAAVHLHRP